MTEEPLYDNLRVKTQIVFEVAFCCLSLLAGAGLPFLVEGFVPWNCLFLLVAMYFGWSCLRLLRRLTHDRALLDEGSIRELLIDGARIPVARTEMTGAIKEYALLERSWRLAILLRDGTTRFLYADARRAYDEVVTTLGVTDRKMRLVFPIWNR